MTSRLSSPVFVGRADESSTLRAALQAVQAGEPRTVLVAGEAGVGKSRLIVEFTLGAERAGARVLVGNALELGAEGLPFAPFTAALRSLVRDEGAEAVAALVPDAGPLAHLLPELGGGERRESGPEGARGEMFETFLSLLEALSASQPLVLVLEDLHWADRSTRELFVFLTHSLRAAPVLMVASYRSDDLDRRHPLRPVLAELTRVPSVERLELDPLSRREVGAQAEGILGHEPDTGLLDTLVRRAEGNPLYVEALLDCPNRAECDISETLRDLLLRKVERLPDTTQRVLRIAAASGRRVSYRLLAAVADLDQDTLGEALRAAVESNVLLAGDEVFTFRHALIREAVHDELLPGEHSREHARLAEALEADPTLLPPGRAAVEIAHHWYAARANTRALTAAWAAARVTCEAYAYAEQLSLLERVLGLWEQVPDASERLGIDHVDLLEEAGGAAVRAGNPTRGDSYATSALTEFDPEREPIRAARLLQLRGRCGQQLGRPDRLADLTEAARLVQADPESRTAAGVIGFLASTEFLYGMHAEARADADRALALAERLGGGAPKASALITLGLCNGSEGAIALAIAQLTEAQQIADRVGAAEHSVRAATNLSDILMGAGDYARSIEVVHAGLVKARASGLGRSRGTFLTVNLAEALIELGRYAEATAAIEDALELSPPLANEQLLLRLRSWIALRRGDIDPAADAAEQTRWTAPGRDPITQQWRGQLLLELEIALARGDTRRAGDLFEMVLADERTISTRTLWWLLAVGGRVCAELRAGAVALHDAATVARADTLLAELDRRAAGLSVHSRPEEANRRLFEAERLRATGASEQAAWQAAAAAFGEIHVVFEQAYTLFRAAEAAATAGDRDAATAPLARAGTLARQLGAAGLSAEIARLAARARIAAPDEPAAAAPPAGRVEAYRVATGLTEREFEVLRLLAEGRSNREIGAALFISPKTASVHVSNILGKLEVSSRMEAAAAAHQLRLFDGDTVSAS